MAGTVLTLWLLFPGGVWERMSEGWRIAFATALALQFAITCITALGRAK
jgi:hypothetical protein